MFPALEPLSEPTGSTSPVINSRRRTSFGCSKPLLCWTRTLNTSSSTTIVCLIWGHLLTLYRAVLSPPRLFSIGRDRQVRNPDGLIPQASCVNNRERGTVRGPDVTGSLILGFKTPSTKICLAKSLLHRQDADTAQPDTPVRSRTQHLWLPPTPTRLSETRAWIRNSPLIIRRPQPLGSLVPCRTADLPRCWQAPGRCRTRRTVQDKGQPL